jgi:CRP/FNR family transcriptional regulator, cyclic AMP receptor protein
MFIHTKKALKLAGHKIMEKSLLKQFEGSDGRRHLIKTLILQPLIREQNLAVVVARRVKLEAIPAGTKLIQQGTSDSDLFLILDGGFSIVINGRIVAHAKAGEHVGEMSVVDPDMARSASVIATSDSVVARIAEPDFSALADRFPQLWRRIAHQLAGRLRHGYANDRVREKAGRAA